MLQERRVGMVEDAVVEGELADLWFLNTLIC